jgi:hypothetical protein
MLIKAGCGYIIRLIKKYQIPIKRNIGKIHLSLEGDIVLGLVDADQDWNEW